MSIEVLDYWTYKLTTLTSIPKQVRSDWKWTKQLGSGWNELCSSVKIGHQTYLSWTAELSDPIISLRCSIAWLPNLSIEVLDYWTYKLTTLPSIPKQMRSDWKWTKQLRSGWNELCSWVKIGHQTYLIWTAEFRLNRICIFEHTNSIWSGRWSGNIRLWSGIFWPYSTSNAQKKHEKILTHVSLDIGTFTLERSS